MEYNGRQYVPPKQPSRSISSGDLLGVKSGESLKWNVPSSSRVGAAAVGFQSDHCTRSLSMSSALLLGLSAGGVGNDLGSLDCLLIFGLATRSMKRGSSSMYTGFTSAPAILAEILCGKAAVPSILRLFAAGGLDADFALVL